MANKDFSLKGGLEVNGNIIVTGTVDGRDIATDGTKLSGIDTGAEVNEVTLIGSEILTNKTIDASDNTISNIELTTDVIGVLPVGNYATGTPDGTKFVRDDGTLVTPSGSGDALVANPLSQFAATTSLQLKNTISNETGSGALVFATSPTFVTPVLGTPTSGDMANVTGTASGLTAGNVTTNANLTGAVTSLGNATTITVNSVTLAEMEHGTQGDILYYATTGTPTRLGFGTSGFVLTTNGTGANPSWTAAGAGDVIKVNTPVDNQVGVWTGDGTLEGDTNLTWSGSALGITGDITVSGTVDGRNVATDGTKLDGVEELADVTDATNVAGAGGVLNTGDETIAGVKTFSSDPLIPDEIYGAGWNGNLEPPTKNAVFDKVETLGGGVAVSSQAGVPSSTPATLGDINVDTTNNNVYMATGTASSADWTITSELGTATAHTKTNASSTVLATSDGTQTPQKLTMWDANGDLADAAAASLTVVGGVELATTAEIDAGTDTGRAINTNEFATSRYGTKEVTLMVFHATENCVVGDQANDLFYRVPSTIGGMNLVAVAAAVRTAGTTNTMDIQIANITQAADMLTTKLTIDSAGTDSSTATPAVIDTANDDVATKDILRIDVDAIHTTAAKGLIVELQFRMP